MQRWGPWTQGKLNRLRHDLQGYFRAYYSELRKEIAKQDPDFRVLPPWLKGTRRVHAYACRDGVLIVHVPHDEAADTYEFTVVTDQLVKEAMAEFTPKRSEDLQHIRLLDYNNPEDFGAGSYEAPAEMIHPLPGGSELVEQRYPWTRIDYADMHNLDVWRDKSTAKRRARELVASVRRDR